MQVQVGLWTHYEDQTVGKLILEHQWTADDQQRRWVFRPSDGTSESHITLTRVMLALHRFVRLPSEMWLAHDTEEDLMPVLLQVGTNAYACASQVENVA
jgi:hypothetical protein